jgi:hypothetical protein
MFAGRRCPTRTLVIVRSTPFELLIEFSKILPVTRDTESGTKLGDRYQLMTGETPIEISVPTQLPELTIVDDVEASFHLSFDNLRSRWHP